jgi:Ca-activated chloride channel family protein
MQPEGGSIEIKPAMRLGPILRDEALHVLFEFMVEASAIEAKQLALLNGSLKISIAVRPTPIPPIRLNFTREIHSEPSAAPPPARILSALSRMTLYRMQERARVAADNGSFDDAARHLHNLATHLLSQGEHSLAKTVLFEADNLEKTRNWGSNGNQKDIKYSTRALLLSGAKESVK